VRRPPSNSAIPAVREASRRRFAAIIVGSRRWNLFMMCGELDQLKGGVRVQSAAGDEGLGDSCGANSVLSLHRDPDGPESCATVPIGQVPRRLDASFLLLGRSSMPSGEKSHAPFARWPQKTCWDATPIRAIILEPQIPSTFCSSSSTGQ
jgi:hypothetical protein